MQRRVTAIYFVFFLVLGAGAYSVIAFADAPTIDVPGQTYGNNDTFRAGGQEYTVTGVSQDGGSLAYTNQSFRYTAALANNSTVPAADVVWSGQRARHSQTFEDGSSIQYNGSEHTVQVNGSNVTFQGEGGNQSFADGDTLQYRGNNTTVASVEPDTSVTLAWGEPYRVTIANESNVSSFTFVQEFNVTNRLRNDPAVYNQTTTVNGTEHVTYRENNTNRPLSEYLPEPERKEVAEGDDLQYQNNGTTVANVSRSEVTLEWVQPKNQTVELSEGGNVTLADDTQYFAHFHSEGGEPRVTLAKTQQSYSVYSEELGRQAYFQERMNGLWGVIILSAIAAILVAALALMPVKG